MLFARLLDRAIKIGSLTLIDANGRTHNFGDGTEPKATFRLHDRRLHTTLAISPLLKFGEAYVDGKLTVEDGSLYDLLAVAARNYRNIEEAPGQRWLSVIDRAFRRLQQYNPGTRARRNVAHHYDLSNAFYALFLDSDRQYSCAYFTPETTSLEQAQDNKKRHIAAKLLLDRPGLRVLDIGSGWGGMSLYLARAANADVTGITLSAAQHEESVRRAKAAGLSHRVHFHLRDYRHESQKYDRIVSVGMFEHVGSPHFDEFFAKARDLLTDDGVFLLHSIGRMSPPGATNSWIRKYIFPGGYTPALSEVLASVERTGLWVTDVEVLRVHYADTLREWHKNFQANRDKVREQFDERFCRMWEFYLAGCEVSFRYIDQIVFQLQLARRQDAVPITRDYVADWDRTQTVAEAQAAE